MVAGNQYSLSINVAHAAGDNSFNFTIYGSNNCSNLPFTGICPTTGWDVLSTTPITFTSLGQWELVTFTFIPTQDINAIVFGGDCNPHPLSGSGAYNYYYIDEMILAETSLFSSIVITPAGSWCTDDLSLTASTDTTGGTWQWFKDSIALFGETNPNLNVSSNNYGIGNYTIKLTIGNKCETTTHTVSLPDYPVANFDFDTICHNLMTTFTDLSTVPSGSITSWEWDFGDGNNSLSPSPTNIYTQSGTLPATLIVTSDIGCKDTLTDQVLVYPNPTSDFTVADVCLEEASIFQNSSSIATPDNISNFTWTFGDGNSSNDENPTHYFLSEGTYNLKLVAQSNNGCLDSMLTTTRVHPKPLADFSVFDDCVNTAAEFSDNSSIASGSITSWEWNFDDASPLDPNQNPSHLYAINATYQPQLIVISDFECSDTVSNPTVRFPIPQTNFTSTPDCFYDSIIFNNTTTIEAPATVTSWIWNFGDGSAFSSNQNQNHLYGAEGNYTVSLIASSNNGCVKDTSILIETYPIPVANFTSTTVCENFDATSFTNLSTINNGSITSFFWDFDYLSNTSNLPNPTFDYSSPGVYNVTLIVTSDYDCKDTLVSPVTVKPKPTADMLANVTEGCSPICVDFTDNSTSIANSNIISWSWEFNNGENSLIQSPSTCFVNNSNTEDQNFTISLIAGNDLGCYDTITNVGLITSWHNPIASFSPSPEETNLYEAEILTSNNSIGADAFYWDFDNSLTSTEFEPTVNYGDTGIYNIMLAVKTINDCVDTTYNSVLIKPVISIYIPNTFTPDNDGNNDGFIFKGYGIDESSIQFYIFDRWGTLIYYTEGTNPWDGTYKGVIVNQDTYIYKLLCKDVFGEDHEYKGHVNLLK